MMLSTGYEMPKLPIGKVHMYLHVMNINYPAQNGAKKRVSVAAATEHENQSAATQ